jgi:P-type Cu+ transporter
MAQVETKKIELLVEGMDCNNCALGIKKQLDGIGMKDVSVNFATGDVVFGASGTEEVIKAVDKINSMGYKVVANLTDGDEVPEKRVPAIAKKFWFCFAFTLPLLTAMFLPFPVLHDPYLQLILTLPVFAVGLWHFGRSAVASLRSGVPNMDVLIILGSTAAFIYSLAGMIMNLGHKYMFFETTASIITLILLGNYLEHIAVSRTTSAIDDLVKMQKTLARRITGYGTQDETLEEVESVREN